MAKENEFITKLRKSLFSGNDEVVQQALTEIRNNGTPQVVELLLDLHVVTSNKVIKNNISQLLADLKDTNTITIIANAISNPKYTKIKKELLSICWQNGMDFSPYALTFAQILCNETLETAFEAYTVLDELRPKLSAEIRKQLSDLFIDNLTKQPQEKKDLIILLLENLK